MKKYADKIEIKNVEKTIKNVKIAKQAISIGAWALNCILMGIVLPKLNQKLTAEKKAIIETYNKKEDFTDYSMLDKIIKEHFCPEKVPVL